jgi:hypothetical protein
MYYGAERPPFSKKKRKKKQKRKIKGSIDMTLAMCESKQAFSPFVFPYFLFRAHLSFPFLFFFW